MRQMNGMGGMQKKQYPQVDLHYNSNITIQMDDKPRLKSQYMKKYSEERQNPSSRINNIDRPAGTQNLVRLGKAPQEDTHLNPSRRKILNDFITQRPRGSLEAIYNRNTSDLLKMPGASVKNMHTGVAGGLYERQYQGAPPAQVGPVNGKTNLLQMQ